MSCSGTRPRDERVAAPVELSSLQSVSYDWYVDPASTPGAGRGPFQPVFRFNMAKIRAFAGQLILEHV